MKTEDWKKLITILESMIPYYERINLAVTFFMLWKWRNIAARLAKNEDVVLEIGSGPGAFSRLLNSEKICCLDPSKKMLSHSKKILKGDGYSLLAGIGEHLPLKEDCFDKVYCLFSFRDFMDRNKGAGEIRRVLRKGGSFIIIDILKPTKGLRKRIIDIWIRYGTRIALRLLVPKAKKIWKDNPYEAFFNTYEGFETEETLKKFIESSGFKDAKAKYLGFGAHMLVANKGDGA